MSTTPLTLPLTSTTNPYFYSSNPILYTDQRESDLASWYLKSGKSWPEIAAHYEQEYGLWFWWYDCSGLDHPFNGYVKKGVGSVTLYYMLASLGKFASRPTHPSREPHEDYTPWATIIRTPEQHLNVARLLISIQELGDYLSYTNDANYETCPICNSPSVGPCLRHR